jgi:hypothetical protein
MKRDTRRPLGESSEEPESDVELGFSFFEKVGCTPESSAHLVTKTLS